MRLENCSLSRLRQVLAYTALASATAILSIDRVSAEDAATSSSGSPVAESYQQEVASEAEGLQPTGAADGENLGKPTARQSEPGTATTEERVDQVKAAVREALGEPPPGSDPAVIRRQRLRELVDESPMPEGLQDSSYVRDLREEVLTTPAVREVAETGVWVEPRADAAARELPEDYQVQPGDSLWKIAVTLFGDGNKWKAIYDENRDTMTNSNVLIVGQELKIPSEN